MSRIFVNPNCKKCKSRSGYWCMKHKRSVTKKGITCFDFKEKVKVEYVKVFS